MTLKLHYYELFTVAAVYQIIETNRLSGIGGVMLVKGAGKKVDEVAGKSFVETIAKMHFANTEKARGWLGCGVDEY